MKCKEKLTGFQVNFFEGKLFLIKKVFWIASKTSLKLLNLVKTLIKS